MYIWMIYDRAGLRRNADYVSLYRKHCRKYQMDVIAVYDDEVKGRVLRGERPVCAFVRTINPEINRYLEEQRIPVYNSYEVSRICNHKGKTLKYLQDKVFCVPSITLQGGTLLHILNMDVSGTKEFFGQTFSFSIFYEKEKELLERSEDFVVKTVDGHGGAEVFSLMRERERIKMISPGREVVLQPMISSGKSGRDLRVYVIGRRIVAAVMRSSADDFRANYSRGGSVRLFDLKPEQKEIAWQVIHAFDFGMAGIDFILDENDNFILNEIEDVVGARMLYECAPEIDIAREYLDDVLGRIAKR